MKTKVKIKIAGMDNMAKYFQEQKNVQSTVFSDFIIKNMETLTKEKVKNDKLMKENLKFADTKEYSVYETKYQEIFKNIKSEQELTKNKSKIETKIAKLNKSFPEEAKIRAKVELALQANTTTEVNIKMKLLNKRKIKTLTPVQYGILYPLIVNNRFQELWSALFKTIKM